MKTFIVAVASGNEILTVDGIEHEGKLWLVPIWHDYPAEKASKPALMIRFDNLEHQKTDGLAHDYVVTRQVPRGVLDGKSNEGFDTLSGDQITFGIRFDKKTH